MTQKFKWTNSTNCFTEIISNYITHFTSRTSLVSILNRCKAMYFCQSSWHKLFDFKPIPDIVLEPKIIATSPISNIRDIKVSLPFIAMLKRSKKEVTLFLIYVMSILMCRWNVKLSNCQMFYQCIQAKLSKCSINVSRRNWQMLYQWTYGQQFDQKDQTSKH